METTTGSALLREQWKQNSLARFWSDPSLWWTQAVDAVAEVLTGGSQDAEATFHALGRERAAAGVYIDETRSDIRAAAEVAGLSPLSTAQAVDALTLGWLQQALDEQQNPTCIDPLTELASVSYLMARFKELNAAATVQGNSITETHALVVVQTSETSDCIERETRMITAQVALKEAFPGGETLARVGPRCAVALVRRDTHRLPQAQSLLAAQVRIASYEGRLGPTRSWVEALPEQPHAAFDLFAELGI
jgi:hypothetical protein